MEVDQFQKDAGNEQNIKLQMMCITNTEAEARTITDVVTAANSISVETCENGVIEPPESNIKIIKLESYAEEKSNAFVSTPTVEASGQWTTAQMQTPNQNQGVGYSFPWPEIVSDSQRLNNDLLTLLDTNGGIFSENGGNNANTQVNQVDEENEAKSLENDLQLQDMDLCSQSQSMSETSTTGSSSQLTDDCEMYNYVYLAFPSHAQSTSTSTTTTTTPAIPVALPQTKVECLQSGFSTPSSSAPIFPVPAIALPMPSEAMTNAQLEKNRKVSRRREKNKECSRQFRLKQKQKLIKLKEGKLQKEQHLITLHKVMELKVRNLQNILSVGCEKAREILKSNSMEGIEVIKENIPM